MLHPTAAAAVAVPHPTPYTPPSDLAKAIAGGVLGPNHLVPSAPLTVRPAGPPLSLFAMKTVDLLELAERVMRAPRDATVDEVRVLAEAAYAARTEVSDPDDLLASTLLFD